MCLLFPSSQSKSRPPPAGTVCLPCTSGRNRIPFLPHSSIPNEETVTTMLEANRPAALKRYRSFRELREQI
jgi:hypothetical protein